MNHVLIHAASPTAPTVKPVLDEPAQGVTPVNGDNLSVTRQLSNVIEETYTFMTWAEVYTIL